MKKSELKKMIKEEIKKLNESEKVSDGEMKIIKSNPKLFHNINGRHNKWKGAPIRKGKRLGAIIDDVNGTFRILTVKFTDGKKEEIMLANMGPDPKSVKEYEWYSNGTWARF